MKKFIKSAPWALVLVLLLTTSVSATRLLVPGGEVIGLELSCGTVTVASFADDSVAQQEGMQVGDQITAIDGRSIHTAEDVHKALTASDGTVKISVLRQGKARLIRLSPQITGDGPRLGIYLRQGITGVGTVTWYDPDSGQFAALGHGVNAPNGELAAMTQGRTYAAAILSVRKGQAGKPGQLLGALDANAPLGLLQRNTLQGVFGTVDVVPAGQPLPVAEDGEVRTGPAIIRSTVENGSVQEYSVEILKIYPNSDTRNLLLHVTDPDLLNTTGGIVQGM